MKKRILALLLTVMMATALVACSGEDNRTTDEVESTTDAPADENAEQETEDAETSSVDSVSILNDVWATYGESDKFYAMGGDMNNPVDNAPGLYSLEDKEALAAMLLVKDDAAGMIDEAASLIHGMNTNIFTGASFRLTDAGNAQAFADSMKNSILTNQWMCGSPDQYVIYSVYDEYVVVAFGAMDVMNVFKANFTSVHGDAVKVLYEENVAQ